MVICFWLVNFVLFRGQNKELLQKLQERNYPRLILKTHVNDCVENLSLEVTIFKERYLRLSNGKNFLSLQKLFAVKDFIFNY